MTQEEKAKRYDEAYEKVAIRFGSNVADEIFPELKESEDERIRKEIIIYLKNILSNKKYGDKFIESWIAWLEKQGEQKEVAPKFRVGDTIRNIKYPSQVYKITNIDRLCYISGETEHTSIRILIIDQDKWELVERNPAWSEEDEIMYEKLHNLIYLAPYCDSRKELSDWLKFLKDRYTWKPSDEQMKAIKHICDGDYKVDLDILDSIYRDFKKLREK